MTLHRKVFTFVVLVGLFGAISGKSVFAVTRYVDLNSPSPTPPYTNWATAATSIQDAVSICVVGDVVLVTNGVYSTGWAVRPDYTMQTNRVMITNNITVTSVNGPLVTSIVGEFDSNTGGPGSNAVRCVFISSGRISGFTLTNGATVTSPNDINTICGGGLFVNGGTASNLIIRNCRSGTGGGGGVIFHVNGGTLSHSTIMQNNAVTFGAGVRFNGSGILRNCLVINNTMSGAASGAGIHLGLSGTVDACTIAGNSGGINSHGIFLSAISVGQVRGSIIYGNTTNLMRQYSAPTGSISWSCTTPLPEGGIGNIDADPLFLNTDTYRISALSPCVDAGTNVAWMLSAGALDIDGEPRLRNGRADIGADEVWQFQAMSLLRQSSELNIVWDTISAGTFELQGSDDLLEPHWVNTGVIVTSVVPYATTTLINASAEFEAYRLKKMEP